MNTKKEYGTIKNLVERLMERDERCRNSDKWLTYRVFEEIAKLHGEKIFIPFKLFAVFPAFETVKRTRAYIQNDLGQFLPTDPEVLIKRGKRERDVKDIMGGKKL